MHRHDYSAGLRLPFFFFEHAQTHMRTCASSRARTRTYTAGVACTALGNPTKEATAECAHVHTRQAVQETSWHSGSHLQAFLAHAFLLLRAVGNNLSLIPNCQWTGLLACRTCVQAGTEALQFMHMRMHACVLPITHTAQPLHHGGGGCVVDTHPFVSVMAAGERTGACKVPRSLGPASFAHRALADDVTRLM